MSSSVKFKDHRCILTLRTRRPAKSHHYSRKGGMHVQFIEQILYHFGKKNKKNSLT
jgi:hypothetical protein